MWGKHTRLRNKHVHPVCLLQRSGAAVWEQQLCLEHLEGRNIMWWVLCVGVPPMCFMTLDCCCGWFQRSRNVQETLSTWSRGQPFPPAAPTSALCYPKGISSAPVSAQQVRITFSRHTFKPQRFLNKYWFIVVKDTVINDHEGGFRCVSAPNCPCVFAGKSYSTGDVWTTKCQTW